MAGPAAMRCLTRPKGNRQELPQSMRLIHGAGGLEKLNTRDAMRIIIWGDVSAKCDCDCEVYSHERYSNFFRSPGIAVGSEALYRVRRHQSSLPRVPGVVYRCCQYNRGPIYSTANLAYRPGRSSRPADLANRTEHITKDRWGSPAKKTISGSAKFRSDQKYRSPCSLGSSFSGSGA